MILCLNCKQTGPADVIINGEFHCNRCLGVTQHPITSQELMKVNIDYLSPGQLAYLLAHVYPKLRLVPPKLTTEESRHMCEAELLRDLNAPGQSGYLVTERGQYHVKQLTLVPYPVKKEIWVDERNHKPIVME